MASLTEVLEMLPITSNIKILTPHIGWTCTFYYIDQHVTCMTKKVSFHRNFIYQSAVTLNQSICTNQFIQLQLIEKHSKDCRLVCITCVPKLCFWLKTSAVSPPPPPLSLFLIHSPLSHTLPPPPPSLTYSPLYFFFSCFNFTSFLT